MRLRGVLVMAIVIVVAVACAAPSPAPAPGPPAVPVAQHTFRPTAMATLRSAA